MAIQEVYFKGPVKWCKVQKPDTNFDKSGSEWSTNVYLDDEGMKAFKASGLRLKQHEDEEGTYIQVRRPTKKRDGTEVSPPKVIDENGKEFKDLVGNGSVCTVKVITYDTDMGKGHRFEGIRIIDLVPYEGADVEDPIGLDDEAPF